MGMNDSSPLDDIEMILSRWWLLTILTIMGGLVGWLISLARPPVYEARASMVVYVEYIQRGVITESESSWYLSTVSTLISPRALGPGLIQEFEQDCENILLEDLQIERRESNWDLVVRCSDPQAVAELANTWVDSAYALLADAYDHGLKVQSLSTTIDQLKFCKDDLSQEICAGISDVDTLIVRLKSLQEEIGKEQQASQGVIPNLVFRIESHATAPAKPSAQAPGVLILSGVIIGLLIGILAATTHPRNPFKKHS